MNEAYVLLNVYYKQQKIIIDQAKKVPSVKEVNTVYGIYYILILLESESMQEIKNAIDVDLHKIDGINNLTSLISVK